MFLGEKVLSPERTGNGSPGSILSGKAESRTPNSPVSRGNVEAWRQTTHIAREKRRNACLKPEFSRKKCLTQHSKWIIFLQKGGNTLDSIVKGLVDIWSSHGREWTSHTGDDTHGRTKTAPWRYYRRCLMGKVVFEPAFRGGITRLCRGL